MSFSCGFSCQLTNGGLSIKRRQLFSSVGELSSSELGERDWAHCELLSSQLLLKTWKIKEKISILKLKSLGERSFWIEWSIQVSRETQKMAREKWSCRVLTHYECALENKWIGRWWFGEPWLWTGTVAVAAVARSTRIRMSCMPLNLLSEL